MFSHRSWSVRGPRARMESAESRTCAQSRRVSPSCQFSTIGNATSLVVSVSGNQLYRLPTLVSGPNTQSANTTLASPVALDTSSPWAN